MGYEIDFLPVGDESKGGDAIALRYGNLHGLRSEQTVIVVDGGYTDDGEALVEHIARYYGTDTVDFVISTHSDQDHITGLEVVLEQMRVGRLLMHLPWKHSGMLAAARRLSFNSSALSEKMEKSFQAASDLEAIAQRKGVPILEPFAGMHTGDEVLRILGPSEEYYCQLLADLETGRSQQLTSAIHDYLQRFAEVDAQSLPETLTLETLRDDGETSPTNNSSVICLLTVDNQRSLLTGDAGIPALEQAVTILEAEGFQAGELNFVQIPHHGSRRNVGPSVLNRLLGPKGQSTQHSTAFASVPKKNPEHKHPAKKVTNAFHRRGYNVHVTKGGAKWHYSNAPHRDGWSASTPVGFHNLVEEDGDS
ncbi:MAG TPA: MBL fold metallo-hydrolase [Mycobacterium sp.]|nr:MBL fold metallo-hydrolase [Mycobacterium sp.]